MSSVSILPAKQSSSDDRLQVLYVTPAAHFYNESLAHRSPTRPHRRRPRLAAQSAQHRRGGAGHGQLRLLASHRRRALRSPTGAKPNPLLAPRSSSKTPRARRPSPKPSHDCTLVIGTGTLTYRKPEQPVVPLPALAPLLRMSLRAAAASPSSSARKSTASPAKTSPSAICSSRFPPTHASPR